MTTGNRTQVANSMIHSDIWLDDASHTVRLEFGSIEDGNRNGNRVKPNVSTTPATPIDEARKAARQERMPTNAAASNQPATHLHGRPEKRRDGKTGDSTVKARRA